MRVRARVRARVRVRVRARVRVRVRRCAPTSESTAQLRPARTAWRTVESKRTF